MSCFLYYSNFLIIYLILFADCPEPVNILAIILGVIGGIIAVGLALLLIWKLLTTIHDRRELAKFEKERQMARWDTVCFDLLFIKNELLPKKKILIFLTHYLFPFL